MKKSTEAIRSLLPKDKYPCLYSKRGFETKRIFIIVPDSRDELCYVLTKDGQIIIP